MSEINPNNNDAILGGQNPPPINALVLGGEAGKQHRSQQEKPIAEEQRFWRNFEYLNGLPHQHATTFAHRRVVNFELDTEIVNPQEIAYALRVDRWGDGDQGSILRDKLFALLQNPNVSKIEALVFGYGQWDSRWNYKFFKITTNNFLMDNYQYFNNLKAIFLGDIEDREMMISNIHQGDVSPILAVYPNLEILHIRGGSNHRLPGNRLRFSEWIHDKLKVLRIESGGLNCETLQDINKLELPALQYLELWLGSYEYGGTSSIEDLIPIISGEKFPKLKYLGLRNCDYSDDIAFQLSTSPLMETLIELDLSMGTLGSQGISYLVNCPAINKLHRLNVSGNLLYEYDPVSKSFPRGSITQLYPELLNIKCELIADNQRIRSPGYRYCVVWE